MRRTNLALIGVLASPVPAFAQGLYGTLEHETAYFGRVALCDVRGDEFDPRVVREGGVAESASVNVPLSPGDRLLTSEGRRCEVEFDTGTVVQLDGTTGIRLETVLAPSLTSDRRLTNLVLEAGQVRIRYEDYGRKEVFQVLTESAAIKLDRSAVVQVAAPEGGETRVGVESGKAAVLFGPSERKIHRRSLKPGESMSVRQDQGLAGGPPARDAFAQWAHDRDRERALPPRSGPPLSATLRDLSPVVAAFAERYSLTHGRWVWTSRKEHAWRPHLNEDADWRPYTRGRWTAVEGRPFWVAQEPWGWVPYHLGYWYEDDAAGWVWLPGSTFAPAWVTWVGCGDALAWWPFGPRDWRRFRRRGVPPPPSCGEDLGYTWHSYPWSTGREIAPRPTEYAKRRGTSGPEPPPSPSPGPERPRPERPPRELRLMTEHLDRLVQGLEAAGPEPDVRPLPLVPGQVARLRPRAETDEAAGPGTKAHAGEAVRAAAAGPETPGGVTTRPDPLPVMENRFRDWNPDVRVALEHGVSIRYDSGLNRVVCQGCRERPGGSIELADYGSGSSGGSGSGDEDGGSAGSGAAASGSAGGSSKSGPIDR